MEHDPGPVPPADETKHSNTIRSTDGCLVGLTRDVAPGLIALSIAREQGGATMTAYLKLGQLAALLRAPGDPCCQLCRFSRYDARNDLRCHLRPPKKRGDETFFPRMERHDYCGQFKAHQLAAVAS